tara:strand:- start:2032 stop:2247 length:216 start_codon:yes stop_codon:yes gene_type:complete
MPNTVHNTETLEPFAVMDSKLSKRQALVCAYLHESKQVAFLHDSEKKRELDGKIKEGKHGLILGHLWIKKG